MGVAPPAWAAAACQRSMNKAIPFHIIGNERLKYCRMAGFGEHP
jgi:hypothetical protein